MDILNKVLKEGRETLSEYESKIILASYQIPVTREIIVEKSNDVIPAAHEIGYPIVMKGCSPEITHKTEKGLIQTDIRDDREALDAFSNITAGMNSGQDSILVQEMIKGKRELVIGLIRDPQFGPCVRVNQGSSVWTMCHVWSWGNIYRDFKGCILPPCTFGEKGCPRDDG